MRNLTLTLLAIMAMILATACSSNKQTEEQPTQKALVLYYSQTGATKAVAEEIKALLNADIEEITMVEPYDGTYDETIQRCLRERQDTIIPQINPINADLSQYDVVFLGYPIWFGTYARPILGLIEAQDFEGKKVVPFCTFGSGGLEASTAELKVSLPKAEILDGYGVRNARVHAVPQEINDFLVINGYIEGEAPQVAEYSEMAPVTEEDVAVFNEACGDYMFPLGTPVSVGKRTTDTSTDYKYNVVSKDAQDNDIPATIYVTAPKQSGVRAEFTRVVR